MIKRLNNVQHLKHSDLTQRILKVYFDTYNKIGYGFNEEIYKNGFIAALRQTDLKIEIEKAIDYYYEVEVLGQYYPNLIVSEKVLLQITATDELKEKEVRRLLNYLKASEYEVGLILNFGIKPEYKRRDVTK